MFSPKSVPLIGVDVAATAIRMVELSHVKTGFRLDRFAIEPLQDGVVTDGTVIRADDLAEAIRRCHEKLRSRIRTVAIALPTESVFIKRLIMNPDFREDELEEEVATRLSALMLIDPSDINIDFQAMDPMLGEGGLPPQDESQLDVLAMAVKRTKIDERLIPIETAGLRVIKVDAETLAIHTVLDEMFSRRGQSMDNKNHAVVEFGKRMTRLLVLRNGEVIYTRDIAFGTDQLMSDVVMRFGVNEENANEMVFGESKKPEGFEGIIKLHVESGTQEVQRAMQLFMTSTAHIGVDAILLHGEGCAVGKMAESIGEALATSCSILDPLEGLELGPAASGASANSAILVVACGLAYRRFDK